MDIRPLSSTACDGYVEAWRDIQGFVDGPATALTKADRLGDDRDA
jgi:hypothetical protein